MKDDDDDEIAPLMSQLEGDDGEDMSDDEIATLKAAQAKLAHDLDMSDTDLSALKPANLDASDGEIPRKVLANLRETQAIIGKLLAWAERKRRPN